MKENKGGFREGVTISRKVKKAKDKTDAVMAYMFKKILNENYIFIAGTSEVIEAVMCDGDLTIGVVEIEGEEIIISDENDNVEKLFMMQKDEKLVKFMDGREVKKLIGLVIKEGDSSDKVSVNIVELDDDKEFKFENVGDLMLKIFPMYGFKKRIERTQKDLLNAVMIDGLIEISKKSKKR